MFCANRQVGLECTASCGRGLKWRNPPLPKRFKFLFSFGHDAPSPSNLQTSPSLPPRAKTMEGWQIMLLVLGALFYAMITIFMFVFLSTEALYPSAPHSSGHTAHREFGWCVVATIIILLASLVWPVAIVVTLVASLVRQFLYTPGYTCCGRTCAKQPPQQQPLHQIPTPAKASSGEYNLEAGRNPAPPTPSTLQGPPEVVFVPPPGHEAMGPKSAAPAGPPPPYN